MRLGIHWLLIGLLTVPLVAEGSSPSPPEQVIEVEWIGEPENPGARGSDVAERLTARFSKDPKTMRSISALDWDWPHGGELREQMPAAVCQAVEELTLEDLFALAYFLGLDAAQHDEWFCMGMVEQIDCAVLRACQGGRRVSIGAQVHSLGLSRPYPSDPPCDVIKQRADARPVLRGEPGGLPWYRQFDEFEAVCQEGGTEVVFRYNAFEGWQRVAKDASSVQDEPDEP